MSMFRCLNTPGILCKGMDASLTERYKVIRNGLASYNKNDSRLQAHTISGQAYKFILLTLQQRKLPGNSTEVFKIIDISDDVNFQNGFRAHIRANNILINFYRRGFYMILVTRSEVK